MAHVRFSSKKVKIEMFEDEFSRHARGGYIGDPTGPEAYGYLRVSDDRQTEDWKTGVQRQVEHLHDAAKRDGVRISWDMIWGDDESGYLIDRPGLKDLLSESSRKPLAYDIVFESIDRMSREWEWQQGWLLYQFETLRKMRVHFFDEAGSSLERMFKGFMAGESMKQAKARMMDGRLPDDRFGVWPDRADPDCSLLAVVTFG